MCAHHMWLGMWIDSVEKQRSDRFLFKFSMFSYLDKSVLHCLILRIL